MSATPDNTLANPDQWIADLERELAECKAERNEYKAERDEALAREAATAEVLQVINSSPGDLAPVFDAILEKAMRLCDASFGTLRTYDGEHFHRAATRGVPSAFADFLAANPQVSTPGTIGGRIVSGAPVVHIVDLKAEEAYRRGEPNRLALVNLGGARTTLIVPLKNDRDLLGVVQIYRQHVERFSEKQVALLQNFAAQAVIAMENARLLTETREALEQQTATAEVLQVINSSPGDLAPVCDAMLEKALRLCGADFGALRGFDGEAFPVLAVHGLATHGAIKPEPDSALGRLLRGENVVHIPDVIDTDGYRSGLPSRIALVQNTGARTALWVALRKEQEVRGAFITTGAKFARSPTNRSPCCRTSPPRR